MFQQCGQRHRATFLSTTAVGTLVSMKPPYVKVDHPLGVPMTHSESLISFLMTRTRLPSRSRFHIGDWLSTVSNEELKDLIVLGESQASGEPIAGRHAHVCDDFLQVAIVALTAEKNARELSIDPGVPVLLELCVGLEHLSRDGFLQLEGTLSIDPEAPPPRVFVTSKGIAAGDQGNSKLCILRARRN